MSRLPIIAIDGPAGAGKSTAARWLAYQLGLRLIDTGALYRSLALRAVERGVALESGKDLALLCAKLKFQFGNLEKTNDALSVPKLKVFCDSIDVSDSIRTPELGLMASNISKLPEVREALLEVQRDFGNEGGIVMEGRDIGTVIFPQADVKFFLTASIDSRAKRRFEELRAAGMTRDMSQVVRETMSRDEQDMRREHAPLRQATDAVLIDSSDSTLEDVVSRMSRIVRERLKST